MRLWRSRSRDAELRKELALDLELEEEEQRASGLPPEAAREAALRSFGNVTLIYEQTRETWAGGWLERVFTDARYAVRLLVHAPGFALSAILTLALGIGGSTAIFSVADAVLLRPLSYPEPNQLIRIWEQAPDGHGMNFAWPNLEDFRSQNHTLSTIAAYEEWPTAILGGREPVRATVAVVTRDFFTALGVAPLRGRGFVQEEQRAHGSPSLIVSYSYWRHSLNSDANLSHFHLNVAGTNYAVVGVMPADFTFPSDAAVWLPAELMPDSSTRTGHNWRVVARMLPGVTLPQARADLAAIGQRLKTQYGDQVDLNSALVLSMAEAIAGDAGPALKVLLGAVSLLLLVACANVAGLLFARGQARAQELALRTALGASRSRLTQQLLIEAMVLTSVAGVLGVVFAFFAVRLYPAILPLDLPHRQNIAVNGPVLLFALLVTVTTAVSLGLLQAWRLGSDSRPETSYAKGRASAGRASGRLRSALIVLEISVTLVVSVSAALLGRSFLYLVKTDPGFAAGHLVTMRFSLAVAPEALDQAAIARQVVRIDALLDRMAKLVPRSEVALAGNLPVAAGDNLADGDFLLLHGHPPPADVQAWSRMSQSPANVGHALYNVVSPGYFNALGIRLLAGRLFSDADGATSPHQAVISETLARQRWPDRSPVGEVIDFSNMDGNPQPLTIVGVVGDVHARGLDLPPAPVIYVSYRQRGLNANSDPVILLRTAEPAPGVIAGARAVFHDVLPEAPVAFSTFSEDLSGWMANRRFVLLLLGSFAAAALLLLAVGLYGVIAFAVAQRTQELGIRIAVGASRSDVFRLVMKQAAQLALSGIGLGLLLSAVAGHGLASMLYEVTASDPMTLLAVSSLVCLVAFIAAWVPALRAVRLDPVSALRRE